MSGGDVLIGSSGFVGGNLGSQREFALQVNSKNASDVRGGTFSHVIFSAARAEKWRANGDPSADAAHIDALIDLLGSFQADRVTLVSTVDVYGVPLGVDETTAISTKSLHAYGANRYRLEEAARVLHPRSLTIRLPALFGPGLKKNVVFDLLHDNQVERIQPASSFQYYDLTRLGADLDRLWDSGVGLANLVTEPILTAVVVDRAFGREPLSESSELPIVKYDVRTVHAGLFAAEAPYIESATSVLGRLASFVHEGPAQ